MTKTCFLYEDLGYGSVPAIMSLMDISGKTGIKYRTLQRFMKGCDKYYDARGNYRIIKVNIIEDGRKTNGNRNNFK